MFHRWNNRSTVRLKDALPIFKTAVGFGHSVTQSGFVNEVLTTPHQTLTSAKPPDMHPDVRTI
jgi:hypothetical protein